MPRIDSLGDVWAGVGDGIISLNKVEVARGGGAVPLDENRVLFGGHWTDGNWYTLVYDKLTKQVAKFSNIKAQELVASNGQWFVSGANGVDASFPVDALTRITPASTDGRGAADRHGTIALSNITGQGFKLVSAGVVTAEAKDSFPYYDITVVGPTQAFWPANGGFAVLNLPPIKVVGPPRRGCYCVVKGRPWVAYYSDGFGFIAHPADDASKIIRIASDKFFHYDAMEFNDSIRVAFSLSAAELPGEIVIEDLDLSKLEPVPVPPVVVPIPEPKPMANITVKSWDSELVSGKLWHATVEVAGVTLTVKKDEKDRLWFESPDATPTGAVRQLILTQVVGQPEPVPVPDPAPDPVPDPVPVPTRDQRFTLSPAIASADLIEIVDHPELLRNVGRVGVAVQDVIFDGKDQGPNTAQALQQAEFFKKLKALGITFVLEMGSLKPGDCDGANDLHDLESAVLRVWEQGGVVGAISMDEPLTSNQNACHIQLDQAADVVAKFIKRGKELGVLEVGWIEAWPFVSFTDQKAFLEKLTARGAKPDHLHSDIDHVTAERHGNDVATFIRDMQALCAEHGVTYGVYVNATKDPIADDATHDANLVALADKLKSISPNVPQVIVASWAQRGVEGGPRNVPNNFGEHGLIATYEKVRSIFAGSPIPEPIPTEPVRGVMKAIVIDEVIQVKRVDPIPNTKLSVLIAPDHKDDKGNLLVDRVLSRQPGGAWETRDPGTQGQYEKCRITGGMATHKPTADEVYVQPFTEVDEL